VFQNSSLEPDSPRQVVLTATEMQIRPIEPTKAIEGLLLTCDSIDAILVSR
jgi:hypothetical protein